MFSGKFTACFLRQKNENIFFPNICSGFFVPGPLFYLNVYQSISIWLKSYTFLLYVLYNFFFIYYLQLRASQKMVETTLPKNSALQTSVCFDKRIFYFGSSINEVDLSSIRVNLCPSSLSYTLPGSRIQSVSIYFTAKVSYKITIDNVK